MSASQPHPAKLGEFQILRELGAGGMGRVYEALDPELDRRVAIKTLLPEISGNQALMERFRAEGVSLARLNHPNITTLFALRRDQATMFLVMEMIDGKPLDHVLAKLGRLGLTETQAIVSQIATGLGYVHREGVIHRDIKPSNIMLMTNGVLKLMDFGIARMRGSKRLTTEGLLGTYAYLAPEQFDGAEGSESSDLYSLGCVVYEMLSGGIPFDASTEAEMMRGHLTRAPAPLRTRLPDIPPEVDDALMRALAKDPSDRFASVDEFAQAFGATMSDTVARTTIRDCIMARVPSALRETRVAGNADPARISGRRPRRKVGLALLGALLVAVVGVSGWQWGIFHSQLTETVPRAMTLLVSPPPSPPPTVVPAPAIPPSVDRVIALPAPTPSIAPIVPAVVPTAPAPINVVVPPVPASMQAGVCPVALQALRAIDIISRLPMPPPEDVVCEALRRLRSGQIADADMLLATAGEVQQFAPAIGALARRYDPLQPNGPGIKPDIRQAANRYKQAVLKGDTTAAPDREALKKFLESDPNPVNVMLLRTFW